MENNEILDLNEDYSQNDEEIEKEEKEAENEKKAISQPSFKEIVIKECTRIIEQYKKIMSDKHDIAFDLGLADPKKTTEECINHIMNTLVSKGIYGGADEIMYEYIHEYYVDNIKAKDGWSNRINNNAGQQQPKVELTEEQKAKLMKQAEENFLREKQRKLEEKEKKRLEKEKFKEQARIKKEQEAKAKAKEEAKPSGGATQMSIFDF